MSDATGLDGSELLTRLLSRNAAVERHLTVHLDAFLQEAGVTPEFRGMVREVIRPALELTAEGERDVIRFAQHGRGARGFAADIADALNARLEAFGDEFDRQATTPAQRKLAANFRGFAGELMDLLWRGAFPMSDAAIRRSVAVAPTAAANDNERGRGGRG